MCRLLTQALVVVLAVLTLTLAASAADPKPPASPPASSASYDMKSLLTPGIMPPTAPFADFNQPEQSSSGLIATMHVRGPEKIIGAAVVLLLLACVAMFAGMLRQVYGGTSPPRH